MARCVESVSKLAQRPVFAQRTALPATLFKTVERQYLSLAGSIPVRLRHRRKRLLTWANATEDEALAI
ncbi:MAG: hypothetical protein ACRDQA_05635 [Nocardioidaceae bacterium]